MAGRPREDVAKDASRGSHPRMSLRRLGGSRPAIVAAVWLALCVLLGVAVSAMPTADEAVDGLIPREHRSPRGAPWVLLELGPDASPDDLLTAAAAVAEALPDERVPLAPPASEVQSWLDAHALYRLPVDRHTELAAALTDDAMASAVQSLHARLGSPMFGVSGAQARRDPLGLRQLTSEETGSLGHVRAHETRPGAPRVTAAGDLVANDGRTLLLQLDSDRDPDALAADVSAAVADAPVEPSILGPAATDAAALATVGRSWLQLVLVTSAGIVLVLSLTLRRVLPVVAVVLCLLTGAALLTAVVGGLGMFSLPFLALVIGFGCEGALDLQRISGRGWPAAAVLGLALVPLWLSPYPVWTRWSWTWLVCFMATMVLVRLVLPALLTLLRASVAWPTRGFVLLPMPLVAVVLAVGLLGGGAWVTGSLRYAGAHTTAPGDARLDARMSVLRQSFFDPDLLASADSPGEDASAALEQAAEDARLWSEVVPTYATRVDSPGSFVLPRAELERRRASLAQLGLRQRMQQLEETLESRGLRPEAFGEFLRGATNINEPPSTRAALEGPLGPWIDRYVERGDDGVAVRTQLELKDDDDAAVPSVERADGTRVTLRGKVVAARRDRDDFGDWLGIYSLCGLWIGSLVVWLGTRSLAVALSAAFAALTTQSGLLVIMTAIGEPVGPHMLPPFLLAGAAATVAAARACRAVDLQRPIVATGLLVTSLCQIVAGLALIATGEPLWRALGLWLTVGCALASGTGLFVAPGFVAMVRRLGKRPEGGAA